ncbi:glycosyltransferase [Arsenicicoccus sp. oral taxon 190]|uniref:glycosyltransferase n=1 Tax=Arsenicicoccus sp. oral taxon 190 TaxID=1658671 RepID=UPI00155DCB95|nr:glycosyltransferase [Arsenicicoccus sp. oral taxon 190]
MTASSGVAVVIPCYDQQAQLDLVLAALELQTLPLDQLEVVVADDGSAVPPVLGDRPYPVRLLRQPDAGFRAAAARHLGAGATSAPVLCFLDADTVPEPDYLRRLAAVVHDGPRGTLAVGRRRHADLAGWTPQRLRPWREGDAPAPPLLDEPAWLREGYARTQDLRAADDRSYRFVISAVMALPRELYDAAGGFDPGFVGYGGEDWDLAHRCWLAGADLRHVPEAVAWHDGPDLAGRAGEGARAVKDRETLHLATVLTDPLARGHGLVWAHPETVVELRGAPDPGSLAATVAALLRDSDAGVWCVDLVALPAPLEHDPRIHVGHPDPESLRRCRHQVVVHGPVGLDAPLRALVGQGPADYGDDGRLLVQVRATRQLARGETAAAVRAAGAGGIRPLDDRATLEARWAGWA